MRKTLAFCLLAFLAIPLGFLVILRLQRRIEGLQPEQAFSDFTTPILKGTEEEVGEGMFLEGLEELNEAYEGELEKMEKLEESTTTTAITVTTTEPK